MPRVVLDNIHVRYPVIAMSRGQSILSSLARTASFGALDRGGARDLVFVHAIRGVSLEMGPGSRVGLIGRNGAGKSTLLRAIAGINWPQQGARVVDGKLSCLLNLNAGIDLDKSGVDNVEFIVRLFGYNQSERHQILQDIADFTELGEYLRLPVRTYSSGMMVRLAFAIATSLPGDVFVVDEVIGAGDTFFMERASARAKKFYSQAKVLVMASHSDGTLREFCTHAIWLDKGQIIDAGPINEVLERYNNQIPAYPGGVAAVFGAPA